MSPEKQRIAIAEACGWKGPFGQRWLRECGKEGEDVWAFCGTGPDGEDAPLPDYLNDLNACHEMEKLLTNEQIEQYGTELYHLCGDHCFLATAAQRAEAFLRTLGLWEDSK